MHLTVYHAAYYGSLCRDLDVCHKATKQNKHKFQSQENEKRQSVPSRLEPNVRDGTISVSVSISVALHTPELLACCTQRFPTMRPVLSLCLPVCSCFHIAFVAVPPTDVAPPQLFSLHMLEMLFCPLPSKNSSHKRRSRRKTIRSCFCFKSSGS